MSYVIQTAINSTDNMKPSGAGILVLLINESLIMKGTTVGVILSRILSIPIINADVYMMLTDHQQYFIFLQISNLKKNNRFLTLLVLII